MSALFADVGEEVLVVEADSGVVEAAVVEAGVDDTAVRYIIVVTLWSVKVKIFEVVTNCSRWQ